VHYLVGTAAKLSSRVASSRKRCRTLRRDLHSRRSNDAGDSDAWAHRKHHHRISRYCSSLALLPMLVVLAIACQEIDGVYAAVFRIQ
jgi:hypothetical protein